MKMCLFHVIACFEWTFNPNYLKAIKLWDDSSTFTSLLFDYGKINAFEHSHSRPSICVCVCVCDLWVVLIFVYHGWHFADSFHFLFCKLSTQILMRSLSSIWKEGDLVTFWDCLSILSAFDTDNWNRYSCVRFVARCSFLVSLWNAFSTILLWCFVLLLLLLFLADITTSCHSKHVWVDT